MGESPAVKDKSQTKSIGTEEREGNKETKGLG
jgi:hypothetical protein